MPVAYQMASTQINISFKYIISNSEFSGHVLQKRKAKTTTPFGETS